MRRRSSSVAVFLRTDTAFIVRFLRARKFDPSAAFRLYARYFEYRAHHGALFRAFRATEPRLKAALLDGFPCVIGPPGGVGGEAGGDGDGTTTTIIVLFASNWDQKVRTRTPGVILATQILERVRQNARHVRVANSEAKSQHEGQLSPRL